jgi:hypothetical protein
MNTYVSKNNQQCGPYNDAQIQEHLRNGTFNYDDPAWREGLSDWQPLHAFYPPQTPQPVAPTARVSIPKPQVSPILKYGGAFIAVCVSVAIYTSLYGPRASQNRDTTRVGAAENKSDRTELSDLSDVQKYAPGVWTYSGRDGRGAWVRLVINPDGTYDSYTAIPTNDNWGKPQEGTWKAATRKYSDSGRRWYGLDTSHDATIILKNGGEMYHINLDVVLIKGDRFPFSK